jgi:chorismate mutase
MSNPLISAALLRESPLFQAMAQQNVAEILQMDGSFRCCIRCIVRISVRNPDVVKYWISSMKKATKENRPDRLPLIQAAYNRNKQQNYSGNKFCSGKWQNSF